MKAKTSLLILLLLITAGNLSAQYTHKPEESDSIKLSGIVFDRDSLEVLPYAKFSYENKSYTTNENGKFFLWAHDGDVIKFSYIGYKDTYVQIKDSLNQRNYIVGVFLSKDTIQLSEVIVIPRYQQLMLEAKYMPLQINPALDNAINNVQQAKRSALTTTPERMDAEANQKMVINERTMGTVYKTQVPPNMIFGIHTDRLIPYIMYLVEKKKMKVKEPGGENLLNKEEANFLLNMYLKQNAGGSQ